MAAVVDSFAVEIDPRATRSVLRRFSRIPQIAEITYLTNFSRIMERDIFMVGATEGLTSDDLRGAGVLNVEGEVEHVFYTTLPPPVEATEPGIGELAPTELQDVLFPIPDLDITVSLPLGAPGLFLGPEVSQGSFRSMGDWEEILNTIQAPDTWPHSRGQGVVICHIDSGVDGSRFPEWKIVGTWTDDAEADALTDEYGHGTLTAMTAASTEFGPDGFPGVAPDALLYILKPRLNVKKAIPTTGLMKAWDVSLGYALNNPDKRVVINNSLGLYGVKNLLLPCNVLPTRMIKAMEPYKVITVWAIGNNRHIAPPGAVSGYCMNSSPYSVSVGAVDRNLAPQYYSSRSGQCYPLSPLVSAPTYGVLPWGSGYRDFGEQGAGTSHAAPQVAGALALLLSRYPDATNPELRAALRAGADPPGGDKRLTCEKGIYWPYHDPLVGAGLLQISNSLHRMPFAREHPSYQYELDFPTTIE